MKKYRYKYFYTLVELLVAMAIFAIISVVMMRFFNSTQQIWTKASQKNVLYADARVALDIMTAELQSALYDNKLGVVAANQSNTPGIYPFWFEFKDLGDATFLNNPYTYVATDLVQQATYNKAYVTQLNFISATTFKPHTNASNICEIKYIYFPVRSSTDPDYPTGVWNILPGVPYTTVKGGVLVRACTGNLKSDGTLNFDSGNINCYYNFLLLPHDPAVAPNRVRDIFYKTSSEKYSQLIDGFVDMKITCYTLVWDNALVPPSYVLRSYNPMKSTGAIATNATDNSLTDEDLTANIGTIISGTPFPVAVKIDLYMLSERDMREWLIALNDAKYLPADRARAANKIKNERMRCFSKTIYLSGSR